MHRWRALFGALALALSLWAAGDALDAPAAGAAQPSVDRPVPTSGVWPLRPRPVVVARFDPPAQRWGSGHRGVDLAGQVGQPVRASLAGRVTFAGRLAGRGVVVVDHGTTRTTYEPVDASVRVGDAVQAGQTIGRLALFGSHCFPRACLHWGWIEGRDHYLDPLVLVGAAPVVLLPVTGVLTAPPTTPMTPMPPMGRAAADPSEGWSTGSEERTGGRRTSAALRGPTRGAGSDRRGLQTRRRAGQPASDAPSRSAIPAPLRRVALERSLRALGWPAHPAR